MKTILNTLFLSVGMLVAVAQQSTDQQTLNISGDGIARVRIYNHRGAVKIKAGSENQITVLTERKLKARSNQLLEEAQRDIYLDTILLEDEVIIFVNAPDRILEYDDEGNIHYSSCCYGKDGWDKDTFRKSGTSYEFNWEVTMPANLALVANNHEKPLEIDGIEGKLIASNHHDDVSVTGAGREVTVKSHHGNVAVSHSQNPVADCQYKTHHGDIKVIFLDNLSADAFFKSHHGSFFTDFTWNPIPMQVTMTEGDGKTKYKIGKGETGVRIGGGGPQLHFKTHHGDILVSR